MATSTSNLLQVVNRVLLDVGERTTTSFQRPAPTKAKAFVQDAFNDVQTIHDWEWLRLIVTADSWSNETATLLNVRRISKVSWDSGSGYFDIPYTDPDSFNYYALDSYDSSTEASTRPTMFTRVNDSSVKFNPYPTNADGKNAIKFRVIKYYDPPDTTTGLFSCPERFVNLLQKRAAAMMAMRHLGDTNLEKMLDQEYQVMLRTYLTKESMIPTSGGFNLYRKQLPR